MNFTGSINLMLVHFGNINPLRNQDTHKKINNYEQYCQSFV